MIVFQDADAHSFVSGYFTKFRDIYLVYILHADGPLVSPVCRAFFHRERYTGRTQLPNRFLSQAASFFPPEFLAHPQFLQVVLPCRPGKRVKEEVHVLFPREPVRTTDGAPAHRNRVPVHSGETDAVDPADHASPGIRINNFIKMQGRNGL